MIYTRLNRTGGIESIKVHGGGDVAEVYGSINEENPIYYKTRTLTGTPPLNFKALGNPLSDYLISGDAVQNGTPTPESPIYPQECGVRTRNVMPAGEKKTVEVNGVTFSSDGNGRYHISGTSSQNSSAQFNLVSGFTTPESVSKGGQGTLSFFNGKSSGIRLVFCNGTTEIDDWGLWPSYRTVTTYKLTGNKYVDSIKFTVAAGITANMTLMPEFTDDGILPPEFEPYGYKLPLNLNGTTQNLYLTEPLRKIGDYADSVSSDGTVTRRIRKLVLTGEESWEFYSGGVWQFFFGNMLSGLPLSSAMSNIAGYGVTIDTRGRYPYGAYLVVDGSKVAFQMAGAKDTFTNVASWKSYLAAQYAAGTPVTVWYILATPTTEQATTPTLTPATGNNTLAIGTTLQPSSVSITGHVKPTT